MESSQNRLRKEGNETAANCNRLKLLAEDGKMRLTDVADTEQLFRFLHPKQNRLNNGWHTSQAYV